jgi:hypothetical protein
MVAGVVELPQDRKDFDGMVIAKDHSPSEEGNGNPSPRAVGSTALTLPSVAPRYSISSEDTTPE